MSFKSEIFKSWILPIGTATIILLACVIIFGWGTYCIAVFFGSFSTLSKYFDSSILNKHKNLSERQKLQIHRDYSLKDIVKIEQIIEKKSASSSMKIALAELENKLLQMFGCCDKSDPKKKKLKSLRGNLGNFRTQLLLPDKEKGTIYEEVARELQSLRPYLEEM